MNPWLIAALLAAAAVGSLVFSTLTYSLRDLSRVRLGDYLEKRGMAQWLEPTVAHVDDLVVVTACGRLLCNIAVVLASIGVGERLFPGRTFACYAFAGALSALVSLFFSVVVPDALTRHAGPVVVGMSVRPLHVLRWLLLPVTKLMRVTDAAVGRAARAGNPPASETETLEQEFEQEILSAVEEGEKEGVVDEDEREMIESVIQFRDTTAGQIMTPRPDIVAIELGANLAHVKQTLEESGHSRLPVYEGTLDHIVGILYARDLLKHLGQPPDRFNMRSAMRPPFYVPETKPLRDLLNDFRLQKVHIAIVLDEYGGTAGLITIEDILEELVGDISDEHEPVEPAMFKRIDENAFDADARIYIDELNRLAGLNLPEDAGYDTLGGFVSTHLNRIPPAGTVFEHDGAKFTVLDAEPQKVNRVRIDLLPQTVEIGGGGEKAAGRA
jgi:putative hemolysin